jgi:hypothetical protein
MLCLRISIAFAVIALCAPPPFARAENLALALPDGISLMAEVRRPADRRPGEKLPVWIVLGGFEHEKEVLDLLHPESHVILASFDYPFPGERRFRVPEILLEAPELKEMIRLTLDGIPALARALSTQPGSGPVCVVGASFGAPFAAVAVARDHLPCLVLVHGFADVRGTLRSRLEQVLGARYPALGALRTPLAASAAWLIGALLALPEPTRAPMLSSEQKVLVIEARDDHLIPRSSREALWNWVHRSSAQSQRIILPGDHLQPGSDALIREITRRIAAWIRS